jgi:hypothetical protein
MFNQFENATTSIKLANLPIVAGTFKTTMLNYQYASNCEYYSPLKEAKTVKEIFDIFGIKFSIDNVNQTFTPVIENVKPFPYFKESLKAIAKYVEDGSLYVKDDSRYYTINFNDGVISGKVRKVGDNPTPTTTPTTTTTQKAPKKTAKTSNKSAKKSAKKFEFTKTTTAPTTIKRDNNTYTVQELVKELLKQMDAGNASKFVKVEADFLFQNEATA